MLLSQYMPATLGQSGSKRGANASEVALRLWRLWERRERASDQTWDLLPRQ